MSMETLSEQGRDDGLRQGDFFAKDIRMLWEGDMPFFVMKDVCAALEISKYRDAIKRLDEYERVYKLVDTFGGQQEMICVTESGLYHLAFMSRKPIAKAFRRWVTAEVLRKNGIAFLEYAKHKAG